MPYISKLQKLDNVQMIIFLIVSIVNNVSKIVNAIPKDNAPNVLMGIQCFEAHVSNALKLLELYMGNVQVAVLEHQELYFLVLIVFQLLIVIHFYLLVGVF